MDTLRVGSGNGIDTVSIIGIDVFLLTQLFEDADQMTHFVLRDVAAVEVNKVVNELLWRRDTERRTDRHFVVLYYCNYYLLKNQFLISNYS